MFQNIMNLAEYQNKSKKKKNCFRPMLVGCWLVHLLVHELILSCTTVVFLVLKPTKQMPKWQDFSFYIFVVLRCPTSSSQLGLNYCTKQKNTITGFGWGF